MGFTKVFIISLLFSFVLTGCKSINVKEKAVTLKGFSYINKLDTAYDSTTGTFTPKVLTILSSGIYNSIPMNNSYKDYLCYINDSSSSIWNSKVKNTNEMLIFATNDSKLMVEIVEALSKKLSEKVEENKE